MVDLNENEEKSFGVGSERMRAGKIGRDPQDVEGLNLRV